MTECGRCRPARRDERGALTPAVIVMAMGLLLLGGLVTDGGRQLNGRLRAEATAEEAARAGATMLDLRKRSAVIDPDAARVAIDTFCARAIEQDPSIIGCDFADLGNEQDTSGQVRADWVEVRVQVETKALLFGIIGVNDFTADVTARASAVQGVVDPYSDLNYEYTPTVDYPTSTINPPETSGSEVTSVPSPTESTPTLPSPTESTPTLPSPTESTPTLPSPPESTQSSTVSSPPSTSKPTKGN